MLLTCTNCQNSVVIDDQVYAQQGGAICEQCHQPMMPVQDNGYGQQWQQAGAAQWGQQQPMAGQWNQAGMDAQQWQQPMAGQWNQAGMDAQQWQQAGGQWGQQPMGGQWGQQPMDGQWGQQPMDGQWGQQPMNGQWGQQPMDAQWGQQPPMDAQWGQQPAGGDQWGGQDQWSQMADKPMETGIFDEAIPAPVIHNDNNERTMALDAWTGDALPLAPPPTPQAQAQQDDGWGGAWQKPNAEELPTSSGPVVGPNVSGVITVGKPMEAGASDRPTREIDARTVQQIYGDHVNPVKEFFKSIPVRYLIISGAVVVVAFIVFGIGLAVINQPEEKEKVFDEKGDIVTDVNAVKPRTFEDIVASSKDLSPSFMPFDGESARDGSIVAISESIGVVYDEKKIADYQDLETSDVLIEKIYESVKNDMDKMGKPIIFLFDEMMPMSVVYRVMYSFGLTSRKLLFGGPTSTGIATFEIKPCAWPDHGIVTFGDECKLVSAELKMTKIEMNLRRIIGEEPLMLTPEGEPKTELSDNIIGNKVHMDNIAPALAKFRATHSAKVRLSPDGDITYGVFMSAALEMRGDIDNPNVKTMFLYKVPLR